MSVPTLPSRVHAYMDITAYGICTYICGGTAACPTYIRRYINVLSTWYVSTLTGVSTMYRGATAGIISTVVLIVLLVLPIYPIHHIVLSGHLGLIAFGNRFVVVSCYPTVSSFKLSHIQIMAPPILPN
jgi:hypothetical protein